MNMCVMFNTWQGLVRDICGVKKVPYIGLKNRLSLQVKEVKEDEENQELHVEIRD